jgi:MFS family permease
MHRSSTQYFFSTWPLLLGMGLLMLGAGLQGTLIGLRATLDEFPVILTGAVMSCYYIGYIGGSICAPQLVQRVGHIRVFAALTSMASVTILVQAIFVTPFVWALLRVASGFCFAGIYVVAESWLNDRATNSNRGSALALYMLVLYVGLGGGQFLLNVADAAGPTLFMLVAVLISLAVVPMTLSVQRAPEFDIPQKISVRELYHASPMGVVGVTASGMITSALFSMGAVYARLSGFDSHDIATFMGVTILAAVLTQLPIGRLSDRVDRRSVLIVVCLLAAGLAAAAAAFGAMSRPLLFLLTASFGGITLTLYSLSLSHINDHLHPGQMVAASGVVILMNGAGAVAGPVVIASLMSRFGPAAYFWSLAVLVGGLALYAIWRKGQRPAVAAGHKVRFVTTQPQAASGRMIGVIAHDAALARDDVH